jgi:hypothetical protein
MPVRPKAHPAARRWNDQWWDYVKHGTPLVAEKQAAVQTQKQQARKFVMQFVIMKSSRAVDTPTPASAYRGSTCIRAGVEPGKVYDSFETANADAEKLTRYNPVGFVVLTLLPE